MHRGCTAGCDAPRTIGGRGTALERPSAEAGVRMVQASNPAAYRRDAHVEDAITGHATAQTLADSGPVTTPGVFTRPVSGRPFRPPFRPPRLDSGYGRGLRSQVLLSHPDSLPGCIRPNIMSCRRTVAPSRPACHKNEVVGGEPVVPDHYSYCNGPGRRHCPRR